MVVPKMYKRYASSKENDGINFLSIYSFRFESHVAMWYRFSFNFSFYGGGSVAIQEIYTKTLTLRSRCTMP